MTTSASTFLFPQFFAVLRSPRNVSMCCSGNETQQSQPLWCVYGHLGEILLIVPFKFNSD